MINEITADAVRPLEILGRGCGPWTDADRSHHHSATFFFSLHALFPPSMPFFSKDFRCSDEESRSFLRHPRRNWSSLNKHARSDSLSRRNELEKWRFPFSINPSTSHFPRFMHYHDAREVAWYLQLEFQSAIMEPGFTSLDIESTRMFRTRRPLRCREASMIFNYLKEITDKCKSHLESPFGNGSAFRLLKTNAPSLSRYTRWELLAKINVEALRCLDFLVRKER